MSPADFVMMASSSVRAVAVLAAAWLLLSSAAVRVAFDAPGARYLRSLPGAVLGERFALVAAAAVVHAPWGAVWIAGSPGRGALIGVASWAAMTAASLVVAALAGRFVRAPRVPRWTSPIGALAGVHARSLTRRRVSALVAGAGLAALGGAFAALVIGHEARDARDAIVVSGAVASIALAASLIAAATAVSESDRAVGWMSAAMAIAPSTRRASSAIVLGILGIAAGLTATAAALAVASLSPSMLLAVVGTNAAIGLGTGLAAVEVGTRARRIDAATGGRAVDGSRVLVGLLLVGVIGLVAIGIFHELGVAAFVAIGAGAAAGGTSRSPS
ncbi:MAG TPA: hypothetical protein VM261_39125 [Kofleriaceae bacterium]|nr:hypothetical protein [Kofleriaceae bacterium]